MLLYSTIIRINPSLTKQRADEIKKLLNDYRTMGAPLRSALKDLGFTITEDGKHYRLKYNGDERYKTTLSKNGQTSGKERIKQRTSLRLCFDDLLLEKHLPSLRQRQADMGSDERCPCLLLMRQGNEESTCRTVRLIFQRG